MVDTQSPLAKSPFFLQTGPSSKQLYSCFSVTDTSDHYVSSVFSGIFSALLFILHFMAVFVTIDKKWLITEVVPDSPFVKYVLTPTVHLVGEHKELYSFWRSFVSVMLNKVGGIRAKKGRVKPKGHSGLCGKVSTHLPQSRFICLISEHKASHWTLRELNLLERYKSLIEICVEIYWNNYGTKIPAIPVI